MSYSDVLPLETVKEYLAIDDAFTDHDAMIERMVESSFNYLSMQTNYIFKPIDKEYHSLDNRINVFDFPINTADYADGIIPLRYGYMTSFYICDSITLNVGYLNPEDIPTDFIDAALQMVKVFYYEAEKQVNTTLIPESVKQIINSRRRFMAL